MISLKINNLKNFTSQLLVKDTFASYLLVEGIIKTFSAFTIDGGINKDFFADDDTGYAKGSYNTWEKLRPICYEIIKGTQLPTYFRFVFKLPDADVSHIISDFPEYHPNDIMGFIVNIRYENGSLTIITSTSLNIFTLDKSVEHAFDTYFANFLSDNGIDFSIC